MLEIDRLEIILGIVNKYKRISYNDLEKMIDVSSSTIRRDAKKLQNKGLIKEIKGGISKIESTVTDIEVEERFKERIKEKKEIALKTLNLIEENDFIYLDAGTTTYYLVEKLENKNVTVVTNGIMHLEKLAQNNIKTILIGGELKFTTKAIVGPEAIDNIEKYRFDKCFLGTNGITETGGFSTPEINEAIIKKKVMQRSRECYILADASKFEVDSNVKFSDLSKCRIITSKKGEKENSIYAKYCI